MRHHRLQRKRSKVIAFRVPESLHQDIKDASERSGLPMSDEITWRLRFSFEKISERTAMMNTMLEYFENLSKRNRAR